MNDERLGADLSTWMKEAELSPPDAVQSAREVAGGLPQTRQLGRWRWLPAFIGTRTDVKPMAQQTTAYQLTTMLATNGQAPTVSGRTRSMFSPAKAITATALAVAVGSVLLIAQPFDQGGSPVPSAVGDGAIAPPVEVTGSIAFDGCRRSFEGEPGAETTLAGSKDEYTCLGAVAMSDSRLGGSVTALLDNVWFEGNGLDASETLMSGCAASTECETPWLETRHITSTIENADGLWRERPRVELAWEGSSQPDRQAIMLDGEGAYEGLIAVLETTSISETSDSLSVFGFILDARQLEPPPRIETAG